MSDHSALKNDAKDQINGHEITCDPVAVLALITEVEALRKDAERYRWLMSDSVLNGTLGICDGWIDFSFKDEAAKQIEEAMQQEAKQ